MDEMCDVISIGSLILLLLNFMVGVILILCKNTTELLVWMKYLMDLVLGIWYHYW